MGVPGGDAIRQNGSGASAGCSILSNVGLAELVANEPSQYVSIAKSPMSLPVTYHD